MSKMFFKVTLAITLLAFVIAISTPALALSLNLVSGPSAVMAMENGTTAS